MEIARPDWYNDIAKVISDDLWRNFWWQGDKIISKPRPALFTWYLMEAMKNINRDHRQ